MRWFSLALLLMLAVVPAVSACPNCKEAVASAGDPSDDDPLREARAYNYSIYFMLGVAYTLLGVGGGVGYRMYRLQQSCRPADV